MTPRMSALEYRATHAKEKKAGRVKGAVPTSVGDRRFDSALEAARYAQLVLLDKAGLITDLECQVNIPLIGSDGPILTPTGRQMHYRADFRYRDTSTGERVIEDAKGFRTEVYRMKKAVLKAMGFEIREIERQKKKRGVR